MNYLAEHVSAKTGWMLAKLCGGHVRYKPCLYSRFLILPKGQLDLFFHWYANLITLVRAFQCML